MSSLFILFSFIALSTLILAGFIIDFSTKRVL